MCAGGEEGGVEDGAAVEGKAEEGLVGGVDERGGDGGDGDWPRAMAPERRRFCAA